MNIMKKIFLIVAAAALSFTLSAQTPKFAYVNFAELVQLMPESDGARTALQTSSKEATETYQSMMEEYQAKYAQYQEKVASWTPAIKDSKEKELSDLQVRIEEFKQNIQVELQQQEAKLMAPIQEKAVNAVNKLAKEGKYVFVFDVTSMLYVDPAQATDLTPAARTALGIPASRTLESLQAELQNKAAEAAAK